MITIYSIPVEKWMGGINQPPDNELWDSRITAQGTWEEVGRELIANLNQDTIDTVNCYLYIKETT